MILKESWLWKRALGGLAILLIATYPAVRLYAQASSTLEVTFEALEQIAIQEVAPLDFKRIIAPSSGVGRAVAKLKTLEPLIKFRVSIASQPGIEALVLAAHEKGTRDVGPLMAFVWSVYDRRAMMVSVVAALALVWLFMRRRRMRRAA